MTPTTTTTTDQPQYVAALCGCTHAVAACSLGKPLEQVVSDTYHAVNGLYDRHEPFSAIEPAIATWTAALRAYEEHLLTYEARGLTRTYALKGFRMTGDHTLRLINEGAEVYRQETGLFPTLILISEKRLGLYPSDLLGKRQPSPVGGTYTILLSSCLPSQGVICSGPVPLRVRVQLPQIGREIDKDDKLAELVHGVYPVSGIQRMEWDTQNRTIVFVKEAWGQADDNFLDFLLRLQVITGFQRIEAPDPHAGN